MQINSLDTIPIPNPNVVGRVVADEAVLVLPEKGTVKVLNEVGARIWSLVDGVRKASEIAEVIFSEFDVELSTAQKDTLDFLEELASRGVISFSKPY
jgi:hypothetical protein